jgi:2-succinyl-5-enolpyruvyl-6-hydroxy-3-cyclohexene-1-carboxylate synthase
MTASLDTHVLLRAFVDELVRSGACAAVTSPGSRSTPLVLALTADGRLPCVSAVDERSAGFLALGMAKATGRAAVLACTSGTAAANYLPAIVEADESRVPLVVLTADRPPELRGSGAGQTIDQIKLYGSSTRWFAEVAPDAAGPQTLRWVRTLACRAVAIARGDGGGPAGPVHLNWPLREPLVPTGPLPEDEPGGGGRADGRPWVTVADPGGAAPAAVEMAARVVSTARRGVLVVGRDERPGPHGHASPLGAAAVTFASAHGWPVLADPLSGARSGPHAIAHYDALLRDAGFADGQRPDVILRTGDLPTSKPLREWLATRDAIQVRLDPHDAWQDPAHISDLVIAADPAAVLAALAGRAAKENAAEEAAARDGWLASWRDADERAATALQATIGDELSEPRLAAELAALLPPEATLVIAASMPIRDVETFAAARDAPPRMLANRGANGIDGTIATAYGIAAFSEGPTVLLVGDVTLAHDIGSLLTASRTGIPLTIVLVDNDGGGIFDFLPVSGSGPAYDAHVLTPTGLDAAKIADVYGLAHQPVPDVPALRVALEAALQYSGTALLHVRTDRAENVALHRRCWAAVSQAIAGGA